MADFEALIDLASERLGGAGIFSSDDFFAPVENLVKAQKPVFIADRYTERGKWMDGWESRRRRDGGHDLAIVRLGLRGVVRGVDIDTSHFLGNAPKSAAIEICDVGGYVPTAEILDDSRWSRVLDSAELQPGSQNRFAIQGERPCTHVRLHIYPDGGVARLRVYGEVAPDWNRILAEHRVIDLAAVEHGGVALAASDAFFSDRRNLNLPGPSIGMNDGWETKRRRGPGHDWVILKLGRPGVLRRAEIDTSHFKGNFPESASLEACHAPSAPVEALSGWREILPRRTLEAHTHHLFDLPSGAAVSHVRMNIFPDGGVARLRLCGEPSP